MAFVYDGGAAQLNLILKTRVIQVLSHNQQDDPDTQ